jgi:serine/threonine-protein kinase
MGGMGEVYEAEQASPRRAVALKLLRSDLEPSVSLRKRFAREIDAMASVEHENVVPIYAQGEWDGLHYFTMRLVPGASMNALIDRRDIPLEDKLRMLAGAAAGLDACHAKGVVHRDVKPENIMVERGTNRGLLADFGIARSVDFSLFTQPGAVVGTLNYMSPEALRGEPSTAKSDLFSFGCVAYRAILGALPRLPGRDPTAVVIPATRRNPRLRPEVDTAFARALALDPRERAGSAGALIAELTSALAPNVDVPSPAPTQTASTWRTARTVRTRPTAIAPTKRAPPKRVTAPARTAPVRNGTAAVVLAVALFVLTPIVIFAVQQLAH